MLDEVKETNDVVADDKKSNKSKSITLKVFSIIGNVLLYILFGLGLIALVFTIMGKKSGSDGISMFNHQYMTIVSPSMEKCDKTDVSEYEIKDIPVNSLICVENVPNDSEKADEWYSSIEVGDVLTFKYYYFEQVTITHRVIDIDKNESGVGYKITLEGDNKADTETNGKQIIDTSDKDSPNYVIGKVVWTSLFLGSVATTFKSPVGMICIVIVPCAIIFIYELIKIINTISKSKKTVLAEASKKKDDEIEELKRRLSQLETSSKKEPEEVETNNDEKAE